MEDGVTLPFWLFVLICALALWALLGSMLIPGVRWFLRRRAQRVIDELNTRLQLKIQPFKLTKRQVLIDQLVFDPEIIRAAEAFAVEKSVSTEEAMVKVRTYAQEIVPSFNAYIYFRVAYKIARWVGRMMYRVRLGYSDENGLANVDPDAGVVFIMNHRSNMDYILVAYLAATRSALSYAVGEWARIWPLHTLLKSLGAYFIRRGSGNTLYRKVLSRYVRMAADGGVVQAVFPEGGLSKDGKLRSLKLGLLSYMVSGYDPISTRDLVFIPVGVNYDRVLEDRSLTQGLDGGAEKKSIGFVIMTMAKFVFSNISLMIRRRWYRFGYAGVNFGTPISLKGYLDKNNLDFRLLEKDDLFEEVEKFGSELMDSVASVIPVLPVSLVATIFLRDMKRKLSELELKAAVFALITKLEENTAHVYIPRQDQGYAMSVGLRMLTLRHIVIEDDGLYYAEPNEETILRYYANSIAHLVEKTEK